MGRSVQIMGYILKYLEQQKSGIFRYRRDVPDSVAAVIGRKTFKQSLQTKDEDLALERWKVVDTQVKSLIKKCRNGKVAVANLSEKAIEAVAHNAARQQLVDDLDVRPKGYEALPVSERYPFYDPFAPLEEQLPQTALSAVEQQAATTHFLIKELEQVIALDDYSALPQTVTDRIATDLKVQGHKGKIDAKTYRVFVAAEIEAQKGIIRRCEGQSVDVPALNAREQASAVCRG